MEEESPGMVGQSNENNNGIFTEYPEQEKRRYEVGLSRSVFSKTRAIDKEGKERGRKV
jgi:hypothetical protein